LRKDILLELGMERIIPGQGMEIVKESSQRQEFQSAAE
jgi:hypothetical protein